MILFKILINKSSKEIHQIFLPPKEDLTKWFMHNLFKPQKLSQYINIPINSSFPSTHFFSFSLLYLPNMHLFPLDNSLPNRPKRSTGTRYSCVQDHWPLSGRWRAWLCWLNFWYFILREKKEKKSNAQTMTTEILLYIYVNKNIYITITTDLRNTGNIDLKGALITDIYKTWCIYIYRPWRDTEYRYVYIYR